MRFSRFLAAALAPLLSAALVGGSPAYAVAPPGDPLATTVVGACSGGPGRASLAVRPTAGGGYRVEVAARDLAEGSRWTVSVVKAAADGRFKDFRRVAVGGGWTVATRFPAPADPDDGVYFFLDAQKRRDDGHRCVVFNSPAAPVAGQAECNHRRLNVVLLAHERDDGSTLVRSFIFGVRPGSHWHLTLTATGATERQRVDFDDRAGGRANSVRSRVVLTGVPDPRLRLVASNKDQGRCLIGVDPPSETPDASLTLHGFRELSSSRT
jgi:hypothetical protein